MLEFNAKTGAFPGKSNTPQQATGHGLACSFRPKGRGIQPSRHSPNIRASAAAWLIARGNKWISAFYSKECIRCSAWIFFLACKVPPNTEHLPWSGLQFPLPYPKYDTHFLAFQTTFCARCLCCQRQQDLFGIIISPIIKNRETQRFFWNVFGNYLSHCRGKASLMPPQTGNYTAPHKTRPSPAAPDGSPAL